MDKLKGELVRWQESLEEINKGKVNNMGDCMIACAYLIYCGFYDSSVRLQLVEGWVKALKKRGIGTSRDITKVGWLTRFYGALDSGMDPKTLTALKNASKKLKDSFSQENMVILQRRSR